MNGLNACIHDDTRSQDQLHDSPSQFYHRWTNFHHGHQQPQPPQPVPHLLPMAYDTQFKFTPELYNPYSAPTASAEFANTDIYGFDSNYTSRQPEFFQNPPISLDPVVSFTGVPTRTKGSQKHNLQKAAEDLTDGHISGLSADSLDARNSGNQGRLPGACTHCKKLKMKCDFPERETICERCKTGGHVCIVEGRKPRTGSNKKQYLLAQIRQKDAVIESLLKELHNPYTATPLSITSYCMAMSTSDLYNKNVLTWLGQLHSNVVGAGGKRQTKEAEWDHGAGRLLVTKESVNDIDDNNEVANATYSVPGPANNPGIYDMLPDQSSPPDILLHGLVTTDDVDSLFKIFYEHINPFISILDPMLHTPATIFSRCPVLFTIVCAISSRYYPEKSEIYPVAMHFAKHSAANALIDGRKSVELCQAYILMSIYNIPGRKWEEERSWLYAGLAIRIATDLNLHQASGKKPQNEKQEREMLNNTRVWMICFNLDQTMAIQYGKPRTVKEDHILHGSQDWYRRSQYNLQYDVHLCAHGELLGIMAKFHDLILSSQTSASGSNKDIDFHAAIILYDGHLTRYEEEWTQRCKGHLGNIENQGGALRRLLLPFLVAYSRLLMFSFGFQQTNQQSIQGTDLLFFNKCVESAKTMLKITVEDFARSGFMRYAPDGYFMLTTFASASLLKLMCREFAARFMLPSQEAQILDLLGQLSQILSLPSISIDERHPPKLYAKFLARLLSTHRRDRGTTIRHLYTQLMQNDQYLVMHNFMQDRESMQGQGYDSRNDTNSNSVASMYESETPIQFGSNMGLSNPINWMKG
ncbi:hypothetical protein C8J56DRAFT_916834 [Mycena floridula]|nr:hypothetical protein C8J56DRAFT_916834 [Mycena floridula]